MVPPGLTLAARSLASGAAVVSDRRTTSSALAERARAIILEVWLEVVVVVVGSERVEGSGWGAGGAWCSLGDVMVLLIDGGLPLGWGRVEVLVLVVVGVSLGSMGAVRSCGEWVSMGWGAGWIRGAGCWAWSLGLLWVCCLGCGGGKLEFVLSSARDGRWSSEFGGGCGCGMGGCGV